MLLNVIASTRGAVCIVHARLSLRATSVHAFTRVQAHAVHMSSALCVYRSCERVTLYSDVVKNMYMFIRYVWLVSMPGYPARCINARTTLEEARGKQCGRDCPGQGEEVITLHL